MPTPIFGQPNPGSALFNAGQTPGVNYPMPASVQDASAMTADKFKNPLALLGAQAQDQNDPIGRQGSKKHVFKPEELMQFQDSGGLKTSGGQIPGYPIERVKGIIRGAKAMGVDPYQALALAMQETGIGMDKSASPRSLLGTSYEFGNHDAVAKASEKYPDLNTQYLQLAQTLKEKLQYGKGLKFVDPNNEAQILQAYNGYGQHVKRENFGKGATKAYGVTIPDEGLNMKRDNYYGKRVLQLKQDMMKQKNWKDLVDSTN